MKLGKITTTALSAAAAFWFASSANAAEQLRYAIGHPPASFLVQAGERFAEVVEQETNGEVTVRVFPMSLLSMAETSGGLRDGLADIGALMTPYFPAEFPHANMIMEASMMLSTLGEDVDGIEGAAFGGAMAELIFTKCPECNDEFTAQNQVFTGVGPTPGYALNCTKPMVTLQDLDGARLRIGGANWARWAEYVGAAPVTMSGNEMLEALSQGILDCIILSIPDVRNFGMGESVTDVTPNAPGGIFAAAYSQMSRETWQRLSEEHRRAIIRAAAIGSAEVAFRYQNSQEEILRSMVAAGSKVHSATDDVRQKTRSFVEEDLKSMPAAYGSQYRVERGEEILSDLRELLVKWVGLVKGADSADALAEIYWDEIYSKVDVTVHGL